MGFYWGRLSEAEGRAQVDTSTAGTQWGTGGMGTKLTAARIATAAGCKMVICNAASPESIAALVLRGQHVGTLFHAHPQANKSAPSSPPLPSASGENNQSFIHLACDRAHIHIQTDRKTDRERHTHTQACT
jgi:hypothetical protein